MSRPRVVFVGGVYKVERALRAAVAGLDVEVEIHDGRTHGGGAGRIEASVRRADWVVLVTGECSHNAVHAVKREAERYHVPLTILRFCGTSQARRIVTDVLEAAKAPASGVAPASRERSRAVPRSA